MFSFLPASRFARHLLFWVAMMGYFLVPQLIYPDYQHTVGRYFFGFAYHQSPYFLLILFSYAFGVGMLYTYGFRWWVLPPLLAGRLGRGLGNLLLTTGLACYLFRLLSAVHLALLDPLLRHTPIRPLDSHFFQGWFFNQVYFNEYTTIILLVASYKFLENWQRKQQQAHQLVQEKLRTEILLVKAQVNPRFLHSSLATLGQLLDQQAAHAPTTVLTLSQFLSYVLYEGQAEQVPLARELAALRHYVVLEQARLSEQLDVSFTVSGDATPLFIAPLLLLPLLENAFQHSATPGEQAWLSFQLSISGSWLKLSLANSLSPEQGAALTEGTGLRTLRQQLAARYAGRHELKLEVQPSLFVAVLTLHLLPTKSPYLSSPLAYETALSLG